MSGRTTLSLALHPLRAGEWIANTPPCVRYSVSGSPPAERRSAGDYRVTNDLLNALQDVRLGEASLLDAVAYHGTSLWQFLPSYIWPSVFRAVELADVLSALSDEWRPARLVCEPVADETNAIWLGVVAALATRRGIPLEIGASPSSLRQRVRDIARRTGLGLARADWRTARVRSRLAVEWKRSSPTVRQANGRKLLWAARARDWVPQPGSARHHDEHLCPLLRSLRSAGWQTVVGVECPYGDPDFVAERFESRLRQQDEGITWRPYFQPGDGAADAAQAARQVLGDVFARLDREPAFHQRVQHRDVPLWPALAGSFKRALRHALPDCAGQLAAASAIVEEERPDAVMAIYENGPFARALVIEAGRRGIPSLGLQHGTIFPNHYDYMHRGIVTASAGGSGFVVPDVTCVWGSAWRDTLVDAGHYPPHSVAVTGNWRYDDLPKQLAAIDLRALRHRLGVPTEIEVAAILSSGQGTVEYVAASLDAVQLRSDIAPVIRLHPSDNPEPVRAELRRRGLPETVMPRIELLELLALSRVVISQWSTVVAEAALAGRPVVLVNLLHLPGAEAYVDSGICVPVDEPAGIAPALARVLDDPNVAARLGDARAAFVQRYFHRADGRAAQRVAGVLEGLLAKHQCVPAERVHVSD